MTRKMTRDLRVGNISGGEKGWAVINSYGRFGDEIVASYLTEPDARTCLEALEARQVLDDIQVYQ